MNQLYEFQEEEFDDYLDGSMDSHQRADFEARLTKDPALREAFDFHQILRKNLQQRPEYEKIKDDVTRIHREMMQPGNTLRRFPNRKWGGIVLLLLVIAAGVWYFWPKTVSLPDNNGSVPLVSPRRDSIKPSTVKKDTIKPPVAVNKSSRSEKEPSDLKMGLSRSPDFIKELPAAQYVVQGENVVHNTGKENFKLTVFKAAGNRPQSDWKGKNITLHIPESQLATPEDWRLLELIIGGETNLYLQTGSDFYQIKIGPQYLIKESDEAVLKWLRK